MKSLAGQLKSVYCMKMIFFFAPHFSKWTAVRWTGTAEMTGMWDNKSTWFPQGSSESEQRRGRNIACQSCDRASLHSRISLPQSLSLSSVYYTGLWGEINLKWQLLGPDLWRAVLTCMQQHQSHLPEVKTRGYHGHHHRVRFIWHLIVFIFGKRKDFWKCQSNKEKMTTLTCLTIKPVILIIWTFSSL